MPGETKRRGKLFYHAIAHDGQQQDRQSNILNVREYSLFLRVVNPTVGSKTHLGISRCNWKVRPSKHCRTTTKSLHPIEMGSISRRELPGERPQDTFHPEAERCELRQDAGEPQHQDILMVVGSHPLDIDPRTRRTLAVLEVHP